MLFLCLLLLIYYIVASAILSFAFTCALFRFYRYSPSILLNLSFAFTEISSSQRLHGERSLSQRRALAVSITSARQLVESKGAPQSIPKFASENPQIRFRETTHALQSLLLSPTKVGTWLELGNPMAWMVFKPAYLSKEIGEAYAAHSGSQLLLSTYAADGDPIPGTDHWLISPD